MSASSITEKNYKKLIIRAGLEGFSFAVADTLNERVLSFDEVDFTTYPKTHKVEEHYWKAFLEYRELTRMYDEVFVLHDNALNAFVPSALFDEAYAGSYLQYNTKVFETDFFAFDTIESPEIKNVYVPYVNINNFLIDQFGPFEYRHSNTVLVTALLNLSRNVEDKLVFVHFDRQHFEIVVVQNRKLVFFNSFEYQNEADFIYYLLFTAEQLNLNPETLKLQLLGNISEDSDLFRMAYKYVRHVSLADVSTLQRRNDFSAAQNLRHFILFQS
ncbi:DUF3822 domain-containing protein [Flavobacterium magnum]|uniref:DUF3822 domain-containing protein n=1 Tax=Flavobacterium magnum TaxID=2162713 RepID=A0A2S0RH00_9FLAO|nr:DUF3822 family protein [Flavobacterium magnum]AWA30885.1 DUF3822 domain-containing protein [Flavobacterium magnum]